MATYFLSLAIPDKRDPVARLTRADLESAADAIGLELSDVIDHSETGLVAASAEGQRHDVVGLAIVLGERFPDYTARVYMRWPGRDLHLVHLSTAAEPTAAAPAAAPAAVPVSPFALTFERLAAEAAPPVYPDKVSMLLGIARGDK